MPDITISDGNSGLLEVGEFDTSDDSWDANDNAYVWEASGSRTTGSGVRYDMSVTATDLTGSNHVINLCEHRIPYNTDNSIDGGSSDFEARLHSTHPYTATMASAPATVTNEANYFSDIFTWQLTADPGGAAEELADLTLAMQELVDGLGGAEVLEEVVVALWPAAVNNADDYVQCDNNTGNWELRLVWDEQPTITSIGGDDSFPSSETDLVIVGTRFLATQNTGNVRFSNSNVSPTAGTTVDQTESSWSDTGCTIASPDFTGLATGTLYLWVMNDDNAGNTWWSEPFAFTLEGASGVTGTGTPAAQVATVVGVGERISTGTGVAASQVATVAGVGARDVSGTGVLASAVATATGAGERLATVSVALTFANSRELRDETNTVLSSLNNIAWEWYDTPGSTAGEPVDSGTFNTNASGEATLTVAGTALADGEFGQLILYHPSDVDIRATLRVPVTD